MNLGPHPAWIAAFREWFGVQPSAARLLLALYQRDGEPMNALALSQAAGVTEGAVPTHVCNLRMALPSEALDRVRIDGYRLSEIGMEECRGAAKCMLAALQSEDMTWPATISGAR